MKMTAPVRQWCNDSRMLREEFAEATKAATQLCNAVPNEISDQLLQTLNEIQYELEDVPVDQRLIRPLVDELNYLIAELDRLHSIAFPTEAQWAEIVGSKGFERMKWEQIRAFQDQFPSRPIELIRSVWQKGQNGPVFGLHNFMGYWSIILAEPARASGNKIRRPVVVYQVEPGEPAVRNLFDRSFSLDGQDRNMYYVDAKPFLRDPIPTSSVVAEILKFLETGLLSWRRPRNPGYMDEYKLVGPNVWMDVMSAPTHNRNFPAGQKPEYQVGQRTLDDQSTSSSGLQADSENSQQSGTEAWQSWSFSGE